MLRERALEEEGKRKEVEAQLETRGAELAAARAEMARLEAEYSKSRENALMEASHLQARTEAAEGKVAEIAEEVATARDMALFEYQSSPEFR